MITVCCSCNRIEQNGIWGEPVICHNQETVSHAYCPDCYTALMERLEALAQRKRNENTLHLSKISA